MTKKNKIRKILFVLIAAAVSVVILLPGIAAAIYWHGIKANEPVQDLTGIVMTPAGDSRLGDTVTASVLLKFPWHRYPTEAVAETGKGATMLSEPAMARQMWGIGFSVWRVTVEMKPYRTGVIPPGKLEIKFNRYNEKTADLGINCRIPEFVVLPLEKAKTSELLVASRLPEPGTHNVMFWTIVLIVAVILVVALYYSFRKRQAAKPALAPWELALLELAELRVDFRQGRVEMETCFVKLTDLVRQYLGKRFRIHAPQQTTYEFLEELNKPGGALPETQRPFLREFMMAADLVKFAKLPPDEYTLSLALDKAETLISETRPPEEFNKKGGAK